jgi:phospholipase C
MRMRAVMLAAMAVQVSAQAAEPAITPATAAGTAGALIRTDPAREAPLAPAAKLGLLRKHVKYVFVLFQENRSFDLYFGTYPGADGLQTSFAGAERPPAIKTASWSQQILDIDGTRQTLHPFLAPRSVATPHGRVPLYPEDIYSVDHSHYGMATSLHFDTQKLLHAKNDAFALDNEGLAYLDDQSGPAGHIVSKGTSVSIPPANAPAPSALALSKKQIGEVAIAHLDCDTVPFLWQYADRFALFDNFRQTTIGPSTPNAIAMIAAQTGETQWALHPGNTGKNAGTGAPYAVPNETDTPPFAGSAADDFAGKPPFGPDEQNFVPCSTSYANGAYTGTCPAPLPPATGVLTTAPLKGAPTGYLPGQSTLTFASLPLSFMGAQVKAVTAQDAHPQTDLADIGRDIPAVAAQDRTIDWGWYQQGYGPEPFDGKATINSAPAATPHASYIVHHNGPQYFGYVGDNPAELAHMHGLAQFYNDIAAHSLPNDGGVFYVRGGYFNNDGLQTADPNPNVRALFAGNDDHGSYADSQISEALVADSVNAIAASPYWAESAIIITYDESDGFYDHVPPRVRSWGPDGIPMAGGPRIPAILISPYAASHVISHVYSEHGSVIKFINQVFGLTPLSKLPDEVHARALGATEAALAGPDGRQTALGPNDGDDVGDMLEAFDNDRLLGRARPIPAAAAIIPRRAVLALPHYGGAGCAALRITPTDYPNGYGEDRENDPPPRDFNPRPTVSIGVPLGLQAAGKSYPGNIPASGKWVP